MLNWNEYKLLKEERQKNDVIETLMSFLNYYKRARDVERVMAINLIYKNFVSERISGDRAISQLLSVSKNGKPESLTDYHARMDSVSKEERPRWNSHKPLSVIRKPSMAGIRQQELNDFYRKSDHGFVRK